MPRDGLLVWNGALSTGRLRLPCADASAQATTRPPEAAEPFAAGDAPEPGAGGATGGETGHRLAADPSRRAGKSRRPPRPDELGKDARGAAGARREEVGRLRRPAA